MKQRQNLVMIKHIAFLSVIIDLIMTKAEGKSFLNLFKLVVIGVTIRNVNKLRVLEDFSFLELSQKRRKYYEGWVTFEYPFFSLAL